MKCTRPELVRCKSGPIDVVERPCGVCPACRAKKAQDWVFRLYAESKLHDKSCMVTLTYDEEHVKKLHRTPCGLYSLCKKDGQNFMKDLRRNIYPKQVRYFLGGEYGEKSLRPHMHLILFGLGPEDEEVIRKSWTGGFVHVGVCNTSSIAYVARYCVKKLYEDGEEYKRLGLEPEFHLESRRPGIGLNAMKMALVRSDDGNYYVWFQGRKAGVPKYYLDKARTTVEKFMARRLSCVRRDERADSYETSGKSEVAEQQQAELNRLAARKPRKKL